MSVGQFISTNNGFKFTIITKSDGTELSLDNAVTNVTDPIVYTTYFDSSFNIVGNNIKEYSDVTNIGIDGSLTNATLVEEFESITTKTFGADGVTVVSSVETGFIRDSSSEKTKEWTYNFDSLGALTSGTETEGSIVRELGSNWTTVSEKGNVDGLGSAVDVTDIPVGAISTTGAVYATISGIETTYYDATGAITGYAIDNGDSTTYFNDENLWVGDVRDDNFALESIEIRPGNNGAYVEVGAFKLKDESYSREWTFNFDKDGNFSGGTETEDGVTKTYNSNWEVTSSVVTSVTGLTALTETEIAELGVFGFDNGDTGFKSTEGSEVKYYTQTDAGYEVVGFTEALGQNTLMYFDPDYMWLGETRIDGEFSRTEFFTENKSAGTFTVSGSESKSGTVIREWNFTHDSSSGDLVSGYDSENGIKTEYSGANWTIVSQKFTGTTTEVTDAAALALIPDVLKYDESGASKVAYVQVVNDWGIESTYFNANGDVLGYSFEDNVTSGPKFKGFNSKDGDFLGSVFEDGSRTEVRFETRDASTGDITEVGAEYNDGTLERSWTYQFDSLFNFKSGTEVANGKTTTFGANWSFIKEEVSDVSALTQTDNVDLIPTSLVFDGIAYYSEQDYGFNVERTYFNPETKELTGYSNTFSFDVGSVYTFYEDADRNWIGDYQKEEDASGKLEREFFFTRIQNADGTYTELGFEAEAGRDRSFEFEVSASGQIISGYEIENGLTTIYKNGQVDSKTVDTSNLTEVTDGLSDLPSAWVLSKDVDGASVDYALKKVVAYEWGGSEATYFDATGNILGIARSWEDTWSGMNASGVSYEDANYNYLGDVFIEVNGSETRKHVRFEEQNTDGTLTVSGLSYIRSETGYEYLNNELERSWNFKFDVNGRLVEGDETIGSITTKYGPGWNIVGTEVAVSNIVTTTLTADDVRFRPDALFVETTDGVNTTYKSFTVKQEYDWGGSETIYFDGAADNAQIIGYENSWSDPNWGYGSNFEDANRNWIGDVFNDGSNLHFNFYSLVNGVRYEKGGEYEVIDDVIAAEARRAYDFEFDDQTGDLIKGTETFGGSTTEYGANWSIVSQTKSNFDVNDFKITSEIEPLIVFLPDQFIMGTEQINGVDITYTYAEEERYGTNDSFITFYDEAGKALGYANIFSDNYGTYINLNDLEWNHLGNVYTDNRERVETRSEVLVGDVKVETGAEYAFVNGVVDIENPVREWEFKFNPVTYNLVEGKETINGVTTNFGANWIVLGKSVSASNISEKVLTSFEASLTPDQFITETTDSNGDPVYTVYASTQNFEWGGSETIYFDSNSDGAKILGYENSWSDLYMGSSGSYFEDANRSFLGDVYNDGDRVNARFETSTLTSRTETGAEYEIDQAGLPIGDAVRTWVFEFSGGNLVSGTETFDGKTTVYGLNWTIESSTKANFDAASLRLTEVDDPTIALIPQELQIKEGDLTVVYMDTRKTTWGEDETSFYDANGKLLGYMFQWNEGNGASGGHFSSADWQPLGNYYDDGSERAEVRTESFDTNTNRITETVLEFAYVNGTLDLSTPTRTFENIYDQNWNFISGSETVAGVTTTFGAGRTVTGKTVDKSDITKTSVTENDAKLLPDQFVSVGGTIDSPTYTIYTTGSETNITYFSNDASDATVLGFENKWTYSYETGPGTDFGTQPYDNLGVSDVTASQTVSPVVYYDVTVATGDLYNGSGSTGNVYYIDGKTNPPQEFVRGSTYVFDQSDASNANHPLVFQTQDGKPYIDGVTVSGVPGTVGATVTFVVPDDAPNDLLYYCETHGLGMGGEILVSTDASNDSIVNSNENSTSSNTITETSSDFQDASDNWIGNVFNDGSYVNANFRYFDADGSYEKGGNYTVSSGQINFANPIEEYSFTFGADGNLDSGRELRNGELTIFGENWIVASRVDLAFAGSKDTYKTYANTADTYFEFYDDIGSGNGFIAGQDAGGAYVYKKPTGENFADFQEFEFFSEAGAVLGYMHVNSYTDHYSGQTNTSIHFQGPDWDFLGNIHENGDFVRFEKEEETSTQRIRTEIEYEKSDLSSPVGETVRIELLDGTFVSRTETRDGLVSTFDKFGGLLSTSFVSLPTLSAQTEADFDYLPDLFVVDGEVFAHVVSGEYGDKQIFFFNDANATQMLGSADYYTWSDGTDTWDDYFFYDASGTSLGNAHISPDHEWFEVSYSVSDGSDTYLIQNTVQKGDWGSREEFYEYFTDGPNDGKLKSGYDIETRDGGLGKKTNFGFDFEVTGVEVVGTFDPAAMGLLEITEPTFSAATLPIAPGSSITKDGQPITIGQEISYSDFLSGSIVFNQGSAVSESELAYTANYTNEYGAVTVVPIGLPLLDPEPFNILDSNVISGISKGVKVTITALPDAAKAVLISQDNFDSAPAEVGDDFVFGEDVLVLEAKNAGIINFDINVDGTDYSQAIPVTLPSVTLDPRSIGMMNPLDFFPNEFVNTKGAYDYILASSANTSFDGSGTEQTIYASSDHPTLPEGSIIGSVRMEMYGPNDVFYYFRDSMGDKLGSYENGSAMERSEKLLADGTVQLSRIEWEDDAREVVTREEFFIYSDFDRSNLLEGYQLDNGVKTTYSRDGSVAYELVDTSQAQLFNDAAVLSFMPESFKINNGTGAYVIQLPDLYADPQQVIMKFYNPDVVGDPVFLGEGILTFEDPITSMSQIGDVPMTLTAYDIDGAIFGQGKLSVLGEGENEIYRYETNYAEILSGIPTTTSTTTVMNYDGFVVDQRMTQQVFDASNTNSLVSTRITENGKTTITFTDGSPTITDFAPTFTVSADTTGEIAQGVAGVIDVDPVTRYDDPDNFYQKGTVILDDVEEGDTVQMSLLNSEDYDLNASNASMDALAYFGASLDGSVTVQVSANEWPGYGNLLFQQETGKYLFEFMSQGRQHFNADFADEFFVISASDTYHTVYQDLEFVLSGANEGSWNAVMTTENKVEMDEHSSGTFTGTFSFRNNEIYALQDISIGFYDYDRYENQGTVWTEVLSVEESTIGTWSQPAETLFGSVIFKITSITANDTDGNDYGTFYLGEYEYTYDPAKFNGDWEYLDPFWFDEGNYTEDRGWIYVDDGGLQSRLWDGENNVKINGENNAPFVRFDNLPTDTGGQLTAWDGNTVNYDIVENHDTNIWFLVSDKPADPLYDPSTIRKLEIGGPDKDVFLVQASGSGSPTTLAKDPSQSTVDKNVYLLTNTEYLGFSLKFANQTDLDYEFDEKNTYNVELTYFDEDGASASTGLSVNVLDDPNEYVPPTNTPPSSHDVYISETIEQGLEIDFHNQFQYVDAEDNGATIPVKLKIKSIPDALVGKLKLGSLDVEVDQVIRDSNLGQLKFALADNVVLGQSGTLVTGFDFTVIDHDNMESVDTYTAEIELVNNPPEISGPIAHKVTTRNVDVSLSLNDFGAANYEDGDDYVHQPLSKIRIEAAPMAGELLFDGHPVLGYPQEFFMADVSKLSFSPATDMYGSEYAKLEFKVSDGYQYSTATYELVFDVNSGNLPPTSEDTSVSAIAGVTYVFTLSDIPFIDPDGQDLSAVQLITATGEGQLTLGDAPITNMPTLIDKSHIESGALKYTSSKEGSLSVTFKVSDGAAESGVYSLTVNSVQNTAPTTSAVNEIVDVGAEIILDDTAWNYFDADGHTLKAVKLYNDASFQSFDWLEFNGNPVDQHLDLTVSYDGLINGDLKIDVPMISGSLSFEFEVFDEVGTGSGRETFTISNPTQPISALSGDEFSVRYDGSFTSVSGSLLSLIDEGSNGANGINVADYAGGKIVITSDDPSLEYYPGGGQVEAELAVDQLLHSSPTFMELFSGDSFTLNQDLSFNWDIMPTGLGDVQSLYVTLMADGEATVQGSIDVVNADPSPVDDGGLDATFAKGLHAGLSAPEELQDTGSLAFGDHNVIEVIFNPQSQGTIQSWDPANHTVVVTGAYGSLEIAKNGSYTYTYNGVNANSVIGTSNYDEFTIITDTDNNSAGYHTTTPKTGTLKFTSNFVNEPAGVEILDLSNQPVADDDTNNLDEGDTGIYKIKLESKPTADVVVSLTSDDASNVDVSPATLTFTAENYNIAQQFVVVSVDDGAVDGNQTAAISIDLSGASEYAALSTQTLNITAVDTDTPVSQFQIVTNASDKSDLVIDTGAQQKSVDLYSDPSDSKILKFAKVTLNDQFVTDQINGISGNSALDLQFALGEVPAGEGSSYVEIKVQDKGNGNYSVETGERSISMLLKVDYSAGSVSIPAQSGIDVTYKGSTGASAVFTVNNVDADTMFVSTGTNNTPNTLNLKLGGILEQLNSTYSSTLLSEPGNYHVSISAKADLSPGAMGVDLPLKDSDGNIINEIRGEIEIVDPPSNLEFHYGGSSNAVVNLTTTEDAFGKVTFDEFEVEDYVFTNFSLAPELQFDFDSAIDTNGGIWNEKVAVRINYDENGNGLIDADDKWVEAIFDVKREGDGQTETISTGGLALDDITISYGEGKNSDGSLKESATLDLSNNEVDIFTIVDGVRGSTPNSMNVRLDSILDEFNNLGGAQVPMPKDGDKLQLTVSLMMENQEDQEIIDGSIIVI